MRVYQLNYYEVMLSDSQPEEPASLRQYELLCSRLLTVEALSRSNALELARLRKTRMEQRPGRIRRLLIAGEFPPFHFLIAKN